MSNPTTATALHEALKVHFGYDTFRPQQEEIITHVLDGKDALIIMPTGGGKSLCYQIPAMVSEGMVLVISPLIALMTDQVQALRANGISAAAINSSISSGETNAVYRSIEAGQLRLLYVSPEKVLTARFLEYLKGKPLSLIAIDEAHCVSIWGNDFRPEYAALKRLVELFTDVPVLALTATADKATQKDICVQLGLRKPRTFLSSFERPNIHISVQPGQGRIGSIQRFLDRRRQQAGIIYCLSRKSTEEVADRLRGMGYRAAHYHAEVESAQRRKVQDAFQRDEIMIVCATIAFGMGIDKSNIRWVIHYNMPKNVESYYQEIGRSGRDGAPAEAVLFYSFRDLQVYDKFITESQADEDFKTVQREKLERIWELSQANSCRTNIILNYFGEYRERDCGHCDNCKNPPKGFDGTSLVQKALSVCVRTNEEAKLHDVVDILRASYRQEIREHGWDKIKTYGAGRDLPRPDWVSYVTQMINLGLLDIDYTTGSQLKLTPLSHEVLYANKGVTLYQTEVFTKTKSEPKKTKAERFEDELFEKLRELRIELAREYRTPPYVVFTDVTLRKIADSRPITKGQLQDVPGIGHFKADEYGARVIRVVRDYIAFQDHLKNPKGKSQLETLKFIDAGWSAEAVAEERKLSIQTVLGHLADLYADGEEIDLRRHIRPEDLEAIREVWIAKGKPDKPQVVKPELPDEMHYGIIRIGMAILLGE
jgi:ATP-dependent DNA helicase RecQ